jgi:uncharacterized protein YbcI
MEENVVTSKKAALEAAISEAFVKFQRNLIGRGPLENRTYIIEDMVLIRSRGVLTVEEIHLAQSERGRQLVKELRQVLRENSSAEAQQLVSELCGLPVISRHSDISTKTGERIEILVRKLGEAAQGRLWPAMRRFSRQLNRGYWKTKRRSKNSGGW